MHSDQADGSRRPATPDELWAGIVAEVATMPDVVANLLREHRPDERGLCSGVGCGTSARGAPAVRWPCSLHSLATAAERLLRPAEDRRPR